MATINTTTQTVYGETNVSARWFLDAEGDDYIEVSMAVTSGDDMVYLVDHQVGVLDGDFTEENVQEYARATLMRMREGALLWQRLQR